MPWLLRMHYNKAYQPVNFLPQIYVFVMCTDGAHLARMKARADAEYYTAVKLAEANKVYCSRIGKNVR